MYFPVSCHSTVISPHQRTPDHIHTNSTQPTTTSSRNGTHVRTQQNQTLENTTVFLYSPPDTHTKPLEEEEEEESSVPTTTDDDDVELIGPQDILPVNWPERIVLVVDRGYVYAKHQIDSLSVLKKLIHTFVSNKNWIDHRHRFALVLYNARLAEWALDFTGDPNAIDHHLAGVESCELDIETDLSTIFDVIETHVYLPREHYVLPPSYIVRTILLFTRPLLPTLLNSGSSHRLLSHRYFTLDILLMYDEGDKHLQTIINLLKLTVVRERSYFLKVPRTKHAEVFVAMAKLLAHPLQRQRQSSR